MKTCRNENCCAASPHTMELKLCQECRGTINGFDCSLCASCSKKLKQCGHCRGTLKHRHKKKDGDARPPR